MAGNNISYIDFYFYEMLEVFDFISKGKVYNIHPFLQEYSSRVNLEANCKNHQSVYSLPFNMKFAKINNWEEILLFYNTKHE